MQEYMALLLDKDYNHVDTKVINSSHPPIPGDFICFEDNGLLYSVIARIHGESLKIFLEPSVIGGGDPSRPSRVKVSKLQDLMSTHRYKNIPCPNHDSFPDLPY